MTYLLLVLLCLSLMGNVFFFSMSLLEKKQTRTQPQSIELQEFLVDLMSGTAMVAVARVDPNNILLRSPKHK